MCLGVFGNCLEVFKIVLECLGLFRVCFESCWKCVGVFGIVFWDCFVCALGCSGLFGGVWECVGCVLGMEVFGSLLYCFGCVWDFFVLFCVVLICFT